MTLSLSTEVAVDDQWFTERGVHRGLISAASCLFGGMETEGKQRLAGVLVSITNPRQPGKVEHDPDALLAVAVSVVLVGTDTFVEIELWAKERLDWLKELPSERTACRLVVAHRVVIRIMIHKASAF